jgi:CBS domain-containing protein
MSLEQDLRGEQVSHLDLSDFTLVEIGTSVRTTVSKMRSEQHHCAIIMDRSELLGIFTDRDILRKIANAPDTWTRPIEDFMTPTPYSVKNTASADRVLHLMDEKKFRNVPVMNEDGTVLGNITHYTIIKYLADRFPEQS